LAPGVDVMISYFCDFRQLGENLHFFLKNKVMLYFFAKNSSSCSKNRQFFPPKNWRTYFKNHNIGPSVVVSDVISGLPDGFFSNQKSQFG
jgi:hypothetical protein